MSHHVKEMIALQYLPTPLSRNWRQAYRMHLAGRENMAAQAPNLAAQEGWHEWRIVTETVS